MQSSPRRLFKFLIMSNHSSFASPRGSVRGSSKSFISPCKSSAFARSRSRSTLRQLKSNTTANCRPFRPLLPGAQSQSSFPSKMESGPRSTSTSNAQKIDLDLDLDLDNREDIAKAKLNCLGKMTDHRNRRESRSSDIVNNSKKEYERAVNELSRLMSNAEAVAKASKTRAERQRVVVPNMNRFIRRSGLSEKDVDDLSIIHVSGTKGKGSTCAFVESILREKGYKTGLFSSPHLVEVRERFRINGRPISRDTFVKYFWKVYSKLRETEKSEGDMPAYFAFNVIVGLHLFKAEAVDVIIMEVGIGGQYDSTNFIRYPAVCGVTSLGLDHMSMLGNTMEEIAWNKAGIFKNGRPAMTVSQSDSCLDVLLNRAKERKNPLHCVPELSEELLSKGSFRLGIAGTRQVENASLAVHLARAWESAHHKEVLPCNVESITSVDNLPTLEVVDLAASEIRGLSKCVWPGRAQTIQRPGITYYLDGAHTKESMEVCSQWFAQSSREECKSLSGKVVRILLFNMTGDRSITDLLTTLKWSCTFDAAVFSTNIVSTVASCNVADQANKTVTRSDMLRKAEANKSHWDKLMASDMVDNNNSCECSCPDSHSSGDANIRKDLSCDSLTSPNDKDSGLSSVAKKGRYAVDSGGTIFLQSSVDSGIVNVGTRTDLARHISTTVSKADSVASTTASSLSSDSSQSVNHHNISQISPESTELNSINNKESQENGGHVVKKNISFSFPCVLHALTWATQSRDQGVKVNDPAAVLPEIPKDFIDADHIQILVTGSLHLVGSVLAVLEPEMND